MVVDCDARHSGWRVEHTPCLTSSAGSRGGLIKAGQGRARQGKAGQGRAGQGRARQLIPHRFWLTARGRRLSLVELARLQGITHHPTTVLIESKYGHAIGNAFTQPLIARLFVRMLPASGVTPPLQDPWEAQVPAFSWLPAS